MSLFTTRFWADAAERAITTAAQSAIAVIGVDALTPIIEVDWAGVGGIAATAAVLSVLKSLVASQVGDTSASLVAPAKSGGRHVAK